VGSTHELVFRKNQLPLAKLHLIDSAIKNLQEAKKLLEEKTD